MHCYTSILHLVSSLYSIFNVIAEYSRVTLQALKSRLHQLWLHLTVWQQKRYSKTDGLCATYIQEIVLWPSTNSNVEPVFKCVLEHLYTLIRIFTCTYVLYVVHTYFIPSMVCSITIEIFLTVMPHKVT